MMHRRTFLLSSAGLAIAPGVGLAPGGGEVAPLSLESWRPGFVARAVAASLPRERVEALLDGVTSDPRVIAADTRQPEFSKPVGAYIAGTVSSSRVATARARRQVAAPWLDPIAARYGVPASVLVAVWGVESDFGAVQGDMDVVRSLATLAASGRRRDFAEGQLIAALRILVSGEATRAQLRGSWAGAMGQTQFTPADYLTWGVDADGNGRRDIWNSAPDALGSAANFLAHKAAWRPGEATQAEVRLPSGFDYGLAESSAQPWAAWRALGVAPATGIAPTGATATEPATLILPQGWRGPAFVTFPNHAAIKVYNNSTAYALAVGLLADRIAGAGPLVAAWPDDPPLSLPDRIEAQEALARLGFDPGTPDGVLGTQTRRAARAWQLSRRLPADGYLDYALIQRLKADAGRTA